MEIFFHDPDDVPLPPEEVRIRTFQAEPYPDGRRVRVRLELTPFQVRPNAEIQITDAAGEEIAGLSVIETVDPRLEFTVHLRVPAVNPPFTVTGVVFYRPADLREEEEHEEPRREEEEPWIVDRAETVFDLA